MGKNNTSAGRTSKKKSKNKWIIIGVIAVMLIGVVRTGGKRDDSKNNNASGETQSEGSIEDKSNDLSIGDSVKIDGITVSVDSINSGESSLGLPTFEVHITYKNNSGKGLSITPYDWCTILHTGSDKAHVGGDASFNLQTVKDGEEWSGIVSLWNEDEPEKIKFESSSLSKSATWLLPENTEESTIEMTTEEAVEHRSGENFVGISNKKLLRDEIKIDIQDYVRNDSTENWRLGRTSNIFNIEEYALDYYKTYFKDDNEVHAIVNFTTETTSCITCLSDYYIDVTIHEYVDKEEHDANILFSGDVINEYFIYLDNGDIEKVR
ncbi:MAG: hypothetical protein NC177_17475 [Ruminococcus flavefaciens]|nr:hypothetical protein [Ruminococcus flavefaciens]